MDAAKVMLDTCVAKANGFSVWIDRNSKIFLSGCRRRAGVPAFPYDPSVPGIQMTKMIEYRRRVEQLARDRNGEPIANGSYEHAAVIVEQMFKNARHQVSILSGNLNARVYGREDVLEQAKLFLAHSAHTARILLEERDSAALRDHPFFEVLGGNTNLKVRYVPEGVRELYEYHFLAMDEDSYRFEPKKDEPVAVAAFGDKSGAQNLLKIFDAIWEVGTEVELPPKATTQENANVPIVT